MTACRCPQLWMAAWRHWSGLPPRQEKRRKRKKRKKRRLPRTSSRPSRCRKLWRFRSCSFSTLSSSSPVVPQRPSWSRLFIRSLSFHSCCTFQMVDARHAVLTALVCTWLVFLVTLHLALCSRLLSSGPRCSASWPV